MAPAKSLRMLLTAALVSLMITVPYHGARGGPQGLLTVGEWYSMSAPGGRLSPDTTEGWEMVRAIGRIVEEELPGCVLADLKIMRTLMFAREQLTVALYVALKFEGRVPAIFDQRAGPVLGKHLRAACRPGPTS